MHRNSMKPISQFKNMDARNAVLLIAAMLCSLNIECPNWQAADNMTDYLPTIRGLMQTVVDENLGPSTVSRNISDECNNLWDQFWNVYVLWLESATSDAVLYGYAYRRHWYWHNNYGVNQQSFIIWKDYNCVSPQNFVVETKLGADSGSTIIQSAMTTVYSSDFSMGNDIWLWLSTAMENHIKAQLASAQNKNSEQIGISGVIVNETPLKFGLRVCASYTPSFEYRTSSNPAPYLVIIYYQRFDI